MESGPVSHLPDEEPSPDRGGLLRAASPSVDGGASAHEGGARQEWCQALRLKLC